MATFDFANIATTGGKRGSNAYAATSVAEGGVLGTSIPAQAVYLDAWGNICGAPLDAVAAATKSACYGALSVARQLTKTYSGNLFTVRRSSDNTSQDIGFTVTGEANVAALTAFVGSGTGYVTKIYDQSGQGNNVTQTNAAYQPVIVSAGTVQYLNGHLTMLCSGSQWLYSPSGVSALANAPVTLRAAGKFSSLVSSTSMCGVGNAGTNVDVELGMSTSTTGFTAYLGQSGNVSYSAYPLSANTAYSLGGVLTTSNVAATVWSNGSSGTMSVAFKYSGGAGTLSIGGSRGASSYAQATTMYGYVSEAMMFNIAAPSADLTTLTHYDELYFGVVGGV